jgi:opacity protein-like surface antigen
MKKIFLVFLMAAGAAAPACALDVYGNLEIGGGLYGAVPVTREFKDAVKTGMGITAYGDWRLNRHFTAGLELAYSPGQESKDNSTYKLAHTLAGLRLRYVLPAEFGKTKGRYYAIAGVAGYMWAWNPSFPNGDADSRFGYSLGGGAEFELDKDMTAGFELRYHAVDCGDDPAHFLAPTLKFTYGF